MRRRWLALGVGKGSRVAIMLPNIPQQVIAYFGILKAGAIVVNTNPTYPAHELEPLLRSVGVETIVTLSGLHERVREIQPTTAIKNIILTDIPEQVGGLFRNSRGQAGARQRHDEGGCVAARRLYMKDLLAKTPATAPKITFRSRPTTRRSSSSPAAPPACPRPPS